MQRKQMNWRETIAIIRKDLALFGHLCVAQFILWRTLRRRRDKTSSGTGYFRPLLAFRAPVRTAMKTKNLSLKPSQRVGAQPNADQTEILPLS